jgi:4-hydroxy-3-polyprenylbenzoate decarboxylase
MIRKIYAVENNIIIIAITGASGAQYGLRLLECLIQAQHNVNLIISPAGRVVLRTELNLILPPRVKEMECMLSERVGASTGQLRVFGYRQWSAPIASGSNPPQAMVVCPCTVGTVGAIANGLSANLIERTATVTLKEHRQLILVIRETPLTALHLENMLRLAQLGVTILPACPGFYFKPQRIEELIDFIVARVLDHLHVTHSLSSRYLSC